MLNIKILVDMKVLGKDHTHTHESGFEIYVYEPKIHKRSHGPHGQAHKESNIRFTQNGSVGVL